MCKCIEHVGDVDGNPHTIALASCGLGKDVSLTKLSDEAIGAGCLHYGH